MKLSTENSKDFRETFQKMEGKEDLLVLLNDAKKLIYGEEAKPFELKHLNYHSNAKANKRRYTAFTVKKKSGGDRVIHAPAKGLKAIQKCLNLILQTVYEPHQHKAATGFVPGRSIVDNAKVHTGSLYVYNLDLKDFFPSIDQARVWARLQHPPFNLNKKNNRLELANIMAGLCCHQMEVERQNETGEWPKVLRNVLPQGAPTSSTITNIICQQLDFYLSAVARRFNLKYSRYADDITFSSQHNVYQSDGEFLKELRRIISEQRFHIKQSKTRLQKEGYRQEVTGLVVNEQVNVPQRYIKQLRMWLYYWEQYGYNQAYEYFLQQYKADKGHAKKGKPNMANVISGKLDYLKMVKGPENALFQKLRSRLDNLIKKESVSEALIVPSETEDSTIKVFLENSISSTLPGKLFHEINIPKDTLLPSVLFIENKISPSESTTLSNRLLPHNPSYTVSFLKKFKVADGSGFKELVHDVILTEEIVKDILLKVKSHPNFILHYKKERVSSLNYLNVGIQKEVIQLIDLFEQEGIPFFHKTAKHPFNNDERYTSFAKVFKKKYRYGSGSEYSKLQSDILKIAIDQKLNPNNVIFFPDERSFNIRSSFFTWQPLIFRGLRHIFQGIADHSNKGGNSLKKASNTEILVSAGKGIIANYKFIEISIFDKESKSKLDSELLLHFYKESTAFKQDFRNLCDWFIECDFVDESSKRLNLLVMNSNYNEKNEIETINGFIGGFKHILRFYDVR